MEINKMSMLVKDMDERLVEGYANVEITDLQGDYIPVDVMKRAMIKFMDRGGVIAYGHSNHIVGKILSFWIDEKENGVKGIKILGKIYKDDKFADEVWERIKSGDLKGFSIGGIVDEVEVEKEGDKRILKNITLHEISIVSEPANPEATIEAYSMAKGEITKKIESIDDLYAIARKLLEEAKKVRGFVENRDESGAYYGMADDIVKFFGALIGDIENGRITVAGEELAKDCKDRYMADEHNFKEMTCPDDPEKKSKFCGCVRYQMSCNGKSLESAKRICAYIYHRKYGGESDEIENVEELQKPFGIWENFDDCVRYMKEKEGYSDEVARKVCGKLQAELEKGEYIKDLIRKVVLDIGNTEKFIYNDVYGSSKEVDSMVDEHKDIVKEDSDEEKKEDEEEKKEEEEQEVEEEVEEKNDAEVEEVPEKGKMDILLQTMAEINDKLSQLLERIGNIADVVPDVEEHIEEEKGEVDKKVDDEIIKVKAPEPPSEPNEEGVVDEKSRIISKILRGEISPSEARKYIRGGE